MISLKTAYKIASSSGEKCGKAAVSAIGKRDAERYADDPHRLVQKLYCKKISRKNRQNFPEFGGLFRSFYKNYHINLLRDKLSVFEFILLLGRKTGDYKSGIEELFMRIAGDENDEL
ncbi:MAG: hypothetical protein RSA97_02260 [Oscillospiraceae bacterium]